MTDNSRGRDVVLVVGSTGYLGGGVVRELRLPRPGSRRMRLRLRLLGRSREGFERAGYLPPPSEQLEEGDPLESRAATAIQGDGNGNGGLECVVCEDTTDISAYRDDWFRDVQVVVCAARPRGAKKEREPDQEQEAYTRMVENLCHMVRSNQVPHLLLLGLSYMGGEEQLPLGSNAEIDRMRETERAAREIMGSDSNEGSASFLTIARVSDMNEIGFLLEFALKTGVWPCAWGHDPLLSPITSHDFGVAVARFVEGRCGCSANSAPSSPECPTELLAGGPQSVRWRELGDEISRATGTELRVVDLPLWVYRVAVAWCRFRARWSSRPGRAASMLVMLGIPMLVDTTNEDHQAFGDDRIEDYIAGYWSARTAAHWTPSSRTVGQQ